MRAGLSSCPCSTRRRRCRRRRLAHGRKVRHILRLPRGDAILVIIPKQSVEKLNRLGAHEVSIFGSCEARPRLLRVPSDKRLEMRVEFDGVFGQVGVEVVGSHHLGDFHQLIVVVVSVEEWLLAEDDACEHAPEAPHVEAVVVVHEVYEQFWSLEVATCDAHVVLEPWVVELRESPVDESELAPFVVDHDVVRLDVSVNDSLAVAVVERLEEFEDVEPYVKVTERGVQDAEVDVVDVLEDERRRFTLRVTHDVEQAYDIRTSAQVSAKTDVCLFVC
mmetsp:Transcript_9963/g.25272  ORF Transcript_9963/g.25272 Transcript_9963/m.25272 type:complete len:276 (-) Transcript_9963:2362-3189(-)